MPPENQDLENQARQIALEIANRRKAGEAISDEQVLGAHPELRGPLLEQLGRLKRVETARWRAEQPPSPEEELSPPPLSDFQGTLDLPELSDSSAFPPALPERSDGPSDGPERPEAPGGLASQPGAPPPAPRPAPAPPRRPMGSWQAAVEQLAARDSAPPAVANAAGDRLTPQLGEPPLDLQGEATRLRITIKEPAADDGQQSTMVVHEPAAVHSTLVQASVPRYRPSVRPPMAIIKLFHDGRTSYNPYPMMGERFRIGRTEGDLIVSHDYWMSGRHAEIQRHKRGDQYYWMLVDLKSTNGTFVQAECAVLHHHDELFLGQERYRFLLQDGQAALMHVTRGAGQQWAISGNTALIGSQPPCGLNSFATDPYLDPLHARLQREPDGNWSIRDNHSQNGVWYRVKEVEIRPNAEFQLGEQRFGFWTDTAPPTPQAALRVASKPLDEAE